jgi:hypothetical protein
MPIGAASRPAHTTSPDAVRLVHVSASQLARAGVVLEPTTARPTIGREQAEAVATRSMGSSRALETILARCRTTTSYPPVDRPCYVVAVDPSGHESSGPVGVPRQKATFSFALVDPDTGDFIRGFEGSGD